MAKKSNVTILTCNGIDGACAAAVALLRFPQADLMISSASSIGYSLGVISGQRSVPSEIHVCGIGVRCDWDEVVKPVAALADKGTEIVWYCGRGYLDEEHDRFEQICAPVFVAAGSNTSAVCQHLGLEADAHAGFLTQLALYDPAIGAEPKPPTEKQDLWCDFINGSALQYFKYMDRSAYADAIRKLARNDLDEDVRRTAEVFRQSGAKYLLVGRSRVLSGLKDRIRRCADTDEHVLIFGETGVGKECVAHLLHERSSRAMEAFVAVNCAMFAGSIELANSELFGHKKGAFTGAASDRQGKLLAANGGVLFLDELGELPPEVQAKLLRVLEDGDIVPVGSDRPTGKVNVRIVAATNRDLPQMIREGKFREDLFHRLNVLRIHVPPLREHSQDIRQIAESTLSGLAASYETPKLTDRDIGLLREYEWPGNVRQLIQVLKRWACLGGTLRELLGEERQLGLTVGDGISTPSGLLPTTKDAVKPLEEIRREYAAHALALHDGKIAATAKALGIAVNTLKKLVRNT